MVMIIFVARRRVARDFRVWRTHSYTSIIVSHKLTHAPQFSGVAFGTKSLISNSTNKWNLNANAQFPSFVEFEICDFWTKATPEK